MKYFLKRIKLSGIKSIDKEIELNFYNKTIISPFSIEESNVKALYGENGSGKSAIIHALRVYKDIIMSENYLYESKNNIYLCDLINLGLKEFKISVEFVQYFEDDFRIFEHNINLSSKITSNIQITHESIYAYKINAYRESAKVLVYKYDQEKTELPFKTLDLEKLSINRLDKESIVSIFEHRVFDAFFDENNIIKDKFKNLSDQEQNDFVLLFRILQFTSKLNIYMEDSDNHTQYLKDLSGHSHIDVALDDQLTFNPDHLLTVNESRVDYEKSPSSQFATIVYPKGMDKFIKRVAKLEGFIRIFKMDLKKININFKAYISDAKLAELVFEYDHDRNISMEFESTGIKKLVSLFDIFTALEKGEIAIIDEFDSNINDVYLIKLVEYFSNYSQGQLFFTTHNLAPMEVLSDKKHALDFISSNSEISSGIKDGNYSMVNRYRRGQIKNLPFNIESFNFLGMFDTE